MIRTRHVWALGPRHIAAYSRHDSLTRDRLAQFAGCWTLGLQMMRIVVCVMAGDSAFVVAAPVGLPAEGREKTIAGRLQLR